MSKTILKKVFAFQRAAKSIGRNANSIHEFKLWLQAEAEINSGNEDIDYIVSNLIELADGMPEWYTNPQSQQWQNDIKLLKEIESISEGFGIGAGPSGMDDTLSITIRGQQFDLVGQPGPDTGNTLQWLLAGEDDSLTGEDGITAPLSEIVAHIKGL